MFKPNVKTSFLYRTVSCKNFVSQDQVCPRIFPETYFVCTVGRFYIQAIEDG